MIRDTIEIQCNKCGIVKTSQKMITYRISPLMPIFIHQLEIDGWVFYRNDEYELVHVLCGHCKPREEVSA